MFDQWTGITFALLAALLFGASTPLAKALLPQMKPMLLAGLLYLGSGIGLAGYWLVRARRKSPGQQEATLTRTDWPWLAGAIAAGGVIGPVLLMWGLATTPASSAALLLNLEGVLTALLARFVFKENFDRRIALGEVAQGMGTEETTATRIKISTVRAFAVKIDALSRINLTCHGRL